MSEEQIEPSPFLDSEQLAKERTEQYLKNLDREIMDNQEKIKFHEELLIDLDKERKARLENHDIMINNFVPLNPNWQFETVKKYQENLAIMQEMTKKRDILNYEANEKQIQRAIELTKEALESLTEAKTKALEENNEKD